MGCRPLKSPVERWHPLDFRFSFAHTGCRSAWLKIYHELGLDVLNEVHHV